MKKFLLDIKHHLAHTWQRLHHCGCNEYHGFKYKSIYEFIGTCSRCGKWLYGIEAATKGPREFYKNKRYG